uniref:(northern house mosquito) hypothetical protein n=1 Tax=Culex pipiens TaxID=7175 RepID=A0A8D8CA09_CULPI
MCRTDRRMRYNLSVRRPEDCYGFAQLWEITLHVQWWSNGPQAQRTHVWRGHTGPVRHSSRDADLCEGAKAKLRYSHVPRTGMKPAEVYSAEVQYSTVLESNERTKKAKF